MKMKHHKKILTGLSAVLILSLVVSLVNLHPQRAHAAGDAYFTLSPSSGSYSNGATFTLDIYETSTSGDQVAGVQANLTYNTTYLQCNGATGNSAAWSYVAQQTCSGGNVEIGEAMTTGGPVASGQQLVGTVSFTVIGLSATGSSGSANVSIISGGSGQATDIQNLTPTSVWNDVTPTATFSLSGPAPVSGGGGSGSGAGSGSGTSSKSSTSKASTPSTPAPTTPTTTTPVSTPSTKTTPTTTKTTPITGSLQIKVTNSQGKAVTNAKVTLSGGYSEYTNGDGVAGFSDLPAGSYTATVTASGAKPYSASVTLNSGKTANVAVKLTNTSSSMVAIYAAIAVVVVIFGGTGLWYMKFFRGRITPPGAFPPGMSGPTVGTNAGPPITSNPPGTMGSTTTLLDKVPQPTVASPGSSVGPAPSEVQPKPIDDIKPQY